jgi:hypothetical protein
MSILLEQPFNTHISRERLHLQGVPSSKAVHRTVFEFTICEALCFIGALPQTLQGLSP